jgi:outer membrane translocation and assembly module TamA
MHRGYYFGRFRDKHLVFTQAEVRKHLFWRIGAAAFGSIGRVYEDFDTILLRKYHPAAGGGLRFKLSKKTEANIRLDIAVTPDSKGFYIYFAEAF